MHSMSNKRSKVKGVEKQTALRRKAVEVGIVKQDILEKVDVIGTQRTVNEHETLVEKAVNYTGEAACGQYAHSNEEKVSFKEKCDAVRQQLNVYKNLDRRYDCTDVPMTQLIKIIRFSPPPLHMAGFKLSLKKQQELSSAGIEIKTGHFTEREDYTLLQNFQNFLARFKLNPCSLLFDSLKDHNVRVLFTNTFFLLRLAKDLNDRTLFHVYTRAVFLLSVHFRLIKIAKVCRELAVEDVAHDPWKKENEADGTTDTWTASEVRQLFEAVKKYTKRYVNVGPQETYWTKVAHLIPSKTEAQCEERWFQFHTLTYQYYPKDSWTKFESCCLIFLLYLDLEKHSFPWKWDILCEYFSDKIQYNDRLAYYWHQLKLYVPDWRERNHAESVVYLYDNYLPPVLEELDKQMSDLDCFVESKRHAVCESGK